MPGSGITCWPRSHCVPQPVKTSVIKTTSALGRCQFLGHCRKVGFDRCLRDVVALVPAVKQKRIFVPSHFFGVAIGLLGLQSGAVLATVFTLDTRSMPRPLLLSRCLV